MCGTLHRTPFLCFEGVPGVWVGTELGRFGGHEATETGLAYAPVSQAHGHNHIVQCFACCTAALHCRFGGGGGYIKSGGGCRVTVRRATSVRQGH